MKAIFGMGFAAALAVASLTVPAQAAAVLPRDHDTSSIIRVEGGCGEGWHRGEDGRCYRNIYRDGYGYGYGYYRPCPPGWHLGPEGRRCWRNY